MLQLNGMNSTNEKSKFKKDKFAPARIPGAEKRSPAGRSFKALDSARASYDPSCNYALVSFLSTFHQMQI